MHAVTVQEAAKRLGVKEDAIRKRLQRGTLPFHKDSRGRLKVHLTPEQYASADTSQDAPDNVSGQPQDEENAALSPLVESLQDQVAYLREQLDAEREARTEERRRADTILAQLSRANEEQARTIRALEAPPEPQDEPESGESRSDRGTPPEEPEKATERPSLWRRIFGR